MGTLRSTLNRLIRRASSTGGTPRAGRAGADRASTGRPPTSRPDAATPTRPRYPGDFTGVPATTYAPTPDGRPDPGEIVWTWVPFEEDHTQGKDRPVLLIARDDPWLLAVMLTSKDHDRDAAQEARAGRHWQDIGSGAWDSKGRPSEVRVDRILRVDPQAVRREGAVLARERFEAVADAVTRAAGRPRGAR